MNITTLMHGSVKDIREEFGREAHEAGGVGVMTATWEDPCRMCNFNEEGGCSCPSSDKWYACPIEKTKLENIRSLEEYEEWAYQKGREAGLWD